MKQKKLTFKALCQRKTEQFLLDGVKSPVAIEKIEKGFVYFVGTERGKEKQAKLSSDDFLKSVNTRAEIEAAKTAQDDGNVKQETKPESTTNEKKEESKPSSNQITIDMIDKGFKFRLLSGGPEYVVTKKTKVSIQYCNVENLSDSGSVKSGETLITEDPKVFVKKMNETQPKLNVPTTAKPKILKNIDQELTVKKSSENLRCILSQAERDRMAYEVSEIQQEINNLEETKKSYTSQIGGEIKELTAKRNLISDKVISGKEFKDVPIEIHYIWKENRKITIRTDTGEVIREAAIPAHELQSAFIEE